MGDIISTWARNDLKERQLRATSILLVSLNHFEDNKNHFINIGFKKRVIFWNWALLNICQM